MYWWKIYFGGLLYMWIPSLIGSLKTISSWNLASWESFISTIILLIGTYAYVFKKKIFTSQIWKYIFISLVVIWIIQVVAYITMLPQLNFARLDLTLEFESIPNSPKGDATHIRNLTLIVLLTTMILSIPALLAIYKLGFTKKKK